MLLYAFYQGAFAADRKRWSDHALAVARLREQALRYQAAADTSAARVADGAAQALDGYALWRRGQLEPAVRTLKIAQQQTTGIAGPEQHINATLRWWLGELLVELDRLREAEVYFKSVAEDPYLPSIRAWYRLGSLYEKVGQYQEATPLRLVGRTPTRSSSPWCKRHGLPSSASGAQFGNRPAESS